MGLGCRQNQGSKARGREIVIPEDDSIERTDWKWCYCCQQYKPIGDFYSCPSKYDGVHESCKRCNNLERVARKRRAKAQ